MKKTSLVIIGLIGLIALSCVATKPTNSQYKNLQVLPKDITRNQMDSVMHHFTDALSVKCNFCHVRTADGKEWNFPADDNKHKLVARKMITMTNELNKKYFNLTGAQQNLSTPLMVTCYTCHNGKKEPGTIPPKQQTK